MIKIKIEKERKWNRKEKKVKRKREQIRKKYINVHPMLEGIGSKGKRKKIIDMICEINKSYNKKCK